MLVDERRNFLTQTGHPWLSAPAFATPLQSLLDDVAADGEALGQLLLRQPCASGPAILQTKVGEQDAALLPGEAARDQQPDHPIDTELFRGGGGLVLEGLFQGHDWRLLPLCG